VNLFVTPVTWITRRSESTDKAGCGKSGGFNSPPIVYEHQQLMMLQKSSSKDAHHNI
jgi:hypothetical protein